MLTFNDDRLIDRLRSEFIPVTANTQDLEYHRSPAQAFYLTLVERTQGVPLQAGLLPAALRRRRKPLVAEAVRWPGAETLRSQMSSSLDPQGMYILGADGTPYGFTNDHDPPDILRFMDRGKSGFAARPPHRTEVSDADVAAPWAATPPDGATVVRVYSRIRPLPRKVWGLNRGVGRDFLWIYPEEAQELLAASGGAAQAVKAGTAVALPAALVGRIVRFHLVDGVRGTPDMWGASEVQRAQFTAQVVKQEGALRTIGFAGEFAMRGGRRSAAPETPGARVVQGQGGRLRGELDLEVGSGRITRFRAFSEGLAYGEGSYTPYPPPGRFRLLIGLVEAGPQDLIARTVPPEEVATHASASAYHAGALRLSPPSARSR